MYWRKLEVLIIFFAINIAACFTETYEWLFPPAETSVELYVDESFNDEKFIGQDGKPLMSPKEAVIDCAQQWNKALEPRLKNGEPVPFAIKGSIHTSFNYETSLNDNVSVVYKIPEITKDISEMIESAKYGDILGYAIFGGDSIILVGELDKILDPTQPDSWPIKRDWAKSRLRLLQIVVCHELGHVLGSLHIHKDTDNNIADSIMNDWTFWHEPHPNTGLLVKEADVESFCIRNAEKCN